MPHVQLYSRIACDGDIWLWGLGGKIGTDGNANSIFIIILLSCNLTKTSDVPPVVYIPLFTLMDPRQKTQGNWASQRMDPFRKRENHAIISLWNGRYDKCPTNTKERWRSPGEKWLRFFPYFSYFWKSVWENVPDVYKVEWNYIFIMTVFFIYFLHFEVW